nr:hypothetical protein [Tanacetum cinerariifolium]
MINLFFKRDNLILFGFQIVFNRGRKKVEDEIGSLKTRLNYEDHSGCHRKVKALEKEIDKLFVVNKNQASGIQELEGEMEKKNFELATAEKESALCVKERQDLLVRLGQTKFKKFDCIHKLLSTVVRRLLQNHEYKQILKKTGGFDAYSDRKLYPKYDKIFETRYLFVAKGYRYSVVNLLKIHLELAMVTSSSTLTISGALVGPFIPSTQKRLSLHKVSLSERYVYFQDILFFNYYLLRTLCILVIFGVDAAKDFKKNMLSD